MTPSPFTLAPEPAERARKRCEIDSARETALDHALDATFPASDPLAVTQPGGGPDRSAGNIESQPAV